MGLNYEQFVILASLAKGGFLSGKSCLMLGRQNSFLRRSSMKRVSKHVGIDFSDDCVKEFLSERFIEPIFYRFGAKSADSIDASDYEDANIVADMNQPIPDKLIGKYDFVYDGGTLEHVYNYPQAIRNVSDLLNTGGVLFSTSPANNEPGHGFYQFSSELISSAFPKHGLEIIAIYLVAARFPSQFYEILWMANIAERITFLSGEPIQIFVVARKSERKQDDNLVLQSDYVAGKWESGADHLTWDRSISAKIKRLLHRVIVLRIVWPLNFLFRSLALPFPAVWPTSPGIQRISIRTAASKIHSKSWTPFLRVN